MTKSRKFCFIIYAQLLGVLFSGSAAGQFVVPDCLNSAFAPTTNNNGLFITAPCQADAECASNCCSVNGGICRAPLSLEGPPRDFCKNGYTVVFAAERLCENENEALGQPLDNATVSLKATGVSYIILLVNVFNTIQYYSRG